MNTPSLDRRTLLALGSGSLALGATRTPAARARPRRRDTVTHDVREWGVEGRAWDETERFYDRLPARAKESVRQAVWDLSRHSAGMLACFEADATWMSIHVALLSGDLAKAHMPASGVSGIDVYARDGAGRWRWVSAARPGKQEYALTLDGLLPGRREYGVYLPLYNGTQSLTVEVPEGAAFAPLAPRAAAPLVYYGTSIAHGACASRPGMAFTAQVARRLDVPLVNLGFSGNGKMEAEVGALIAELEAAAFVVDCLPNMNAAQVTERAEPLVRQLRAARPETPIVLVEDRTNANARWFPQRAAHHEANHAALRAACERLLEAGVEGLHYVADAPFLGEDGEATVDSSHPTDLGMTRYADVLEPVLRPLVTGDR